MTAIVWNVGAITSLRNFPSGLILREMEVSAPLDEEEALRNIQTQGESSNDSTTTDAKLSESDETVIAEDGGVAGNNNRGDEGVLEGVAVGNIDVYSSDSDDDEDTGIVIHAGRATTAAPRRHTPHFDRSSKVYLRPHALTPLGPISYTDTENSAAKVPVKDETKRLRFSHHRTAFDVDIENLESHPWRNKNVDLSDYFNYGFSEATWQTYSERQLLLRGKLGLGPYHPAPVIASLPARIEPAPVAVPSAVTAVPMPKYAPAAILPPAIVSLPPAPAPVMQPPRPVQVAAASPMKIVPPPVMISHPPAPPRAPLHIPAIEPFIMPAPAPAPMPAPPVYAPAAVQPPAMYMQHQQPPNHPGMPNWPGMMGGMAPAMGMMGGPGMGWDPQSGMPPHLAAMGGFGFPGQGGMIPPYGLPMGMMQGGMMGMDQGQGYMADGTEGYHEHERFRNEEFFIGKGSGGDGRGFDQGRRDRHEVKPSGEEDRRAGRGSEKESSRSDPPREERDREKRPRSSSRDRSVREERGSRGDRDRDRGSDRPRDDDREAGKARGTSDRKEDVDDDRDRAKRRRREDEEQRDSRRDRDRDRESDKSSKGPRDAGNRRR